MRFFWTTAAGFALLASCAVEGFVIVEDNATPAATSSASSGGSGGSEATTGGGSSSKCEHASWPGPPTAADRGGEDIEIVVAVRSVDFGADDLTQGPTVGFDLDDRCTCQGDGPSCKAATGAEYDGCDGPQGRDNAVAYLFSSIQVFKPDFSASTFSEGSNNGDWSLLIHVRNYNGLPNDDQVDLAAFPSPGIRSDPCNPSDGVPAWDGTDRWSIDLTAIDSAGAGGGPAEPDCDGDRDPSLSSPKFLDTGAYVTDGVVVANLPEAGLLIPTSDGTTALGLTAGFISGKLEKQPDGTWLMNDGLLVGRWRIDDLLVTLSTVSSGGEPICTDHPLYQLVKKAVCGYPDITSVLGGPTTPCDALSFAMAFDAQSAHLGSIVEQTSEEFECPSETDPANDSCD